MTGEKWKKFFRSKGWLDGNGLRAPQGVTLFVRFRGDEHNISEFEITHISLANEDVLKVDLTPYGFPNKDDKRYYLWDDILYVRNYKSGNE